MRTSETQGTKIYVGHNLFNSMCKYFNNAPYKDERYINVGGFTIILDGYLHEDAMVSTHKELNEELSKWVEDGVFQPNNITTTKGEILDTLAEIPVGCPIKRVISEEKSTRISSRSVELISKPYSNGNFVHV